MKKTLKSILAAALTAITAFSAIPAFAADSGVVYSDDGKVLISYSETKTDKEFTVRNGVVQIAENAFARNEYIEEINLPDSLKEIEHQAFYGCTALKSVTLPENVEEFYNCDNYMSGSFCGCTSLEEINVDEDNKTYKSIDGVVFTKDGKTLVTYPNGKKDETYTVPEGTETIGWESFCEQKFVKNVVIPEGVTKIDGWAFSGCGMETISIPESMKEIGWSAIDGCENLRTIYYAGNIKEFDGIDVNKTEVDFSKDNVSLFEAELVCAEQLPFVEGMFYNFIRLINKIKNEIEFFKASNSIAFPGVFKF